jgi:hypothetical protein
MKKKQDTAWTKLVNFKDKRFNNHHYQASVFLGQNILEHNLVSGHTPTEKLIVEARNMKELLKILGERRKQVHGKDLSLPGNRELYIKYMGENNPENKRNNNHE